MKKAIKWLLVFGCVAVLTACSKEEEPGVILLKAGQHSITLSVEERPDTRVSYSHQEGESVYRFSWSRNDAIGVYVPGRETAVLYTIDEIDGRKATFKLAEDYYIGPGQQMVNIVYLFSLGNDFELPGPNSQNSFGLEQIGQYTVLYAKDVPMTDGQFGNVKLKHATSYLHFPAGFEFITGSRTCDIHTTEAKLEDVYNVFGFKDLIPSKSESDNFIWLANGRISVGEDGKLVNDVYVPFFVPEGGESMSLNWRLRVFDFSGDCLAENQVTPEAKEVMPGMVYEASEITFPSKPIDTTVGNEQTDLGQG